MFSQVSVCPQGREGGVHPLYAEGRLPLGRHPPWVDTPPSRRPLQRTVRVLLECILLSIKHMRKWILLEETFVKISLIAPTSNIV